MCRYGEDTYFVDSRAVDGQSHCRPSAVLGLLQEAATRHAIQLHVSREEMLRRYHCFWMLSRIWYHLEQPLYWSQRVTIRTSHRGGKGVAMYRDFDLLVDGIPVGEAVSLWVLADLDTRKLVRLTTVSEFEGTEGEHSKRRVLGKIWMPETMQPVESRPIHYSDLDVNGHVNNTRYADYASDAVHMEQWQDGQFLSELQLNYSHESIPGDTISLSRGQAEERHYVQGVGQDGQVRFDAVLTRSDH